jgi:hypothetical protein
MKCEISASNGHVTVQDLESRFRMQLPVTTSLPFERLFMRLLAKGYASKMRFTVKVGEEDVDCDHWDLLSVRSVEDYFNHEKPIVTVESKLDRVTFCGFLKLALENRMSVASVESWKKTERAKRPTSKKEVLQSWEYQG